MKKNLLFVVALVAMCATVLSQTYPTAMSITVAGTDKTIEVDGYEDDDLWAEVEVLTFDYSFQDPKADLSDIDASLQVAWNQLGLLIMLAVTDDMGNYFAEGENSWEQDNAEFFFYFGEEGTWGAEAEVSAVSGDSLFSQIRLQLTDAEETRLDGRYLGNWGGPPLGDADSAKCEAFATTTGFGWNVEIIMPWTLFPKKTYEPAKDVKFGFENTIGDADETLRDNQLTLMNDSKTDQAYDNKKYLNTAILGELPTNLPSHFINAISIYPTLVDNVLNLTGDVTSLTIYNVTGQAVLTVKEDNITTVDVSALQSGIYFVELNNTTTQKIVVR